jgi:hypothetical protein
MAHKPLIRCLYSCVLCDSLDIAVDVPARGEEDAAAWMETVTMKIGEDHQRRNPLCRATKIDTLKIPITGANKIGGEPIQ